jgi:hypothetical protein
MGFLNIFTSNVEKEVDWLFNEFDSSKMSKNQITKDNIKKHSSFSGNPKTEDIYSKMQLSFLDNIFESDIEPKAGSILAIALGVVFEHTGIYIGNGKVIELYGNGNINQISLKQFLSGAYLPNPSDLDKIARTGVNIYTACANGEVIADSKIAERAILIKKKCQHVGYNVFSNNCHMFSGFCLFGKDFQKNTGVRFFTNLSLSIMNNFRVHPDNFKWRIVKFDRD